MSIPTLRPKCGDCGVKIGMFHEEGCDVARCVHCACQRLGCECELPNYDRWTGFWPYELEAEACGMDLNEYNEMWIGAVTKASKPRAKK